MKKGMNRRLGLIFGLLLIIFILTIRTGTAFATANSDDNGNGGNSAKTFSIQSSDDYTKKTSITKLVVNAGQVFPIYIYAINNGNAQAPAVNQNIPVQVTLFDPNNNQTFQTNIIIPIGPANTYGTLNISGSLPGKWTVQVVGNPGKGTVTVRDTFTIIGQQPTLSVTPNQSTITLGNTQQFTAIYSDATGNKTDVTQSVTWSSSNLSVAAISSAGLATSSNQGTSTIAARYTINGVTYSNTSLLTVELPTLDVSPDTTTILLGSSQQYQAVRIDSYDSSTDVTQSVTWSSSNTGVATISSSGLVTGKGAGSCTITATYLINGFSVQTTASLTVVNFNISPSAKIISLGSTLQYSAIITDALGKVTDVTQSVTWSSTSVGSVQLSTISPYGLVTSKGLGTCLIQATYIINGVSITTSASLTIIKPVLSITPTTAMTMLGSTQPFQATLTDYDGNPKNVTAAVTWSSDKLNVATIDQATGIATSVSVGTSTITGTYIINGVSITATTPLKIVNLSITPVSTTISLGMTQQYKAEFTDSDGTVTDVTKTQGQSSSVSWTSDNKSVATIDVSGLATSASVGTCTIQGTYTVNEVSITAATPLTIVLPTLSISSTSATLKVGDTQKYQAILTDTTGKMTDVTATWSSDKPNVATIDQATGIATSVSVGTSTITGTYIINGVSITATTPLKIVNLSITPVSTTISLGMMQQYKAEFTDSDGTVTDVTKTQGQSSSVSWTSDNKSVATIDVSGLATSAGVGTCTIQGTYTVNGVSITAATPLTIVLPTLSIGPDTTTVWTGYDTSFKATLKDYTGKPSDVTSTVIWSWNSLPGLASLIFNQSGSVTAYGVGTCTITATDPTSKAYGTATLTIIKPDLSITPLSKNILPGSTQPYHAILTDYIGNRSDVTSSAKWISDNPSVATFDKESNGLAIGGNVAGTCMITAVDPKSGVSNSATLTVMAPTQLRLTLANTEPLSIGGNVQVTVALVYPDNSTKDVINSVTWISSNFNVATVDSTGKLTGIGGGQCIITATDPGSGLSGTVTLTVLPTLTISPPSRRILVGDKLQYNAQLIYVDGTVSKDVTGGVTWNSSNSGVASITTSGLANGIGDGSCNITATFNGSQSNSANLTVVPTNTIKTLIITPVPAVDAIFKDATQQFKAQWQFADGSTLDVTNSVDWSSSIPKVATIDNTGLALGIDAGTSMISATIIVDGKRWTGSYLLTVLPSKGGIIRSWEQ